MILMNEIFFAWLRTSLDSKAVSITLGALLFCFQIATMAEGPISAQARLDLASPFVGTGPDGHA